MTTVAALSGFPAAPTPRRLRWALLPALAAALVVALMVALAAAPAAAAVDGIRVVGLFKDKAVVEIDGQRQILSVGEVGPEGVRLISADTEAAVLEVDGARSRYPLGRHIASEFAPPQRETTVVRAWPDPAGMYHVDGAINGFSVQFLVDTGATHVAMNANQARRLGLDYLVRGEPAIARTASGHVEAYQVRLDRVRVGGITLRNVSATVLDGPHPSHVLLGMSFLGRLEIDRQGQVLELRHSR